MKKEVVCPRCHSEQLSSNKKGYTVGSFIYGGGLIFGANEANKIVITCLMCGTKFNPGGGG